MRSRAAAVLLAGLIGCSSPGAPTRQALQPPSAAAPLPTASPTPSAPGAADAPLRVGGDVKPPVLVSKVDASYPAEARRQRIQGVVIIEAVIDRDGRVDSPRVLRSVDPLLDAAALEAVRFWRYQPATRDGKPVRVFLTVTTSFNLPSSAPGAADAPLRVGGDVKPPVLVFKVDPEYPAEARRQRIRGRVVIEAVIDSDGRVHSTRLLQSADPLLDEAALEAVRLWRYQPATRDGKPVRVFLIVTTSFNLH